jgi:hypothetical protein
MNDTLKILLYAIIRYVIVISLTFLVAHKIIDQEQYNTLLETLTSPQTLAYIGGVLIVIGFAVWTRLKSRMDTSIALELPPDGNITDVKRINKKQPVSAVLSTRPVKAKSKSKS